MSSPQKCGSEGSGLRGALPCFRYVFLHHRPADCRRWWLVCGFGVMKTELSRATVRQVTVGRALEALRLKTPHLAVDVLVDQGGDILNLIHKPTGIDLLWKVPYPVR